MTSVSSPAAPRAPRWVTSGDHLARRVRSWAASRSSGRCHRCRHDTCRYWPRRSQCRRPHCPGRSACPFRYCRRWHRCRRDQ
jgi:hypothetical protein